MGHVYHKYQELCKQHRTWKMRNLFTAKEIRDYALRTNTRAANIVAVQTLLLLAANLYSDDKLLKEKRHALVEEARRLRCIRELCRR